MVNTADSVSVFAEGTYEEQIQELVLYLARGQADEERATFLSPFQNALKTEEGRKPIEEDVERRRKVFSMVLAEVKGLGDGTDKEIEGFFNLIYSHLFALYDSDSSETKQATLSLLQTISSPLSDKVTIKYRILSNLFNAIPRNASLRLIVYNSLIKVALANEDIDALHLSRADVEKWLSEWNISTEEKSNFLKSLVDAYAQSGQPLKSYEYSLSYVRSLPLTSTEARTAATDLIAIAIQEPAIFDFDPLFKLDAVIAAKDHELFALLQIFLNHGLSEFRVWDANNKGTCEKYNLNKTQLERKIRLLTLSSLGFNYVGQNLPYSTVAETLEIEISDVENWIIDAIRAGLIWGKMSQTSQTLHIIRSTARSFEKEQWKVLEKRIEAWKTGLAGVLEVVANARKMAGHSPAQQLSVS